MAVMTVAAASPEGLAANRGLSAANRDLSAAVPGQLTTLPNLRAEGKNLPHPHHRPKRTKQQLKKQDG